MTSPLSPTPPTPSGVPQAAAVQQVAQEISRAKVAQTDELRALAMEITQQIKPDFKAATFRKGIVTAVNDAGTPPTLSLQLSGDTETTISGVRRMEGYSPTVGQTVLVLKQGSEIMALGHIATTPESPWTQASLNFGFDHDGHSNGNLEFRLIVDHGSQKVQWRGGVDRNSGTTVCNVPSGFRPSSRRSLPTARNANGMNVVRIDFQTGGDVDLVGLTTSPGVFIDSSFDGTSFNGDSHVHSHGGDVTSTSFVETHQHTLSHDHGTSSSTPSPNWISFNGLEYFL